MANATKARARERGLHQGGEVRDIVWWSSASDRSAPRSAFQPHAQYEKPHSAFQKNLAVTHR